MSRWFVGSSSSRTSGSPTSARASRALRLRPPDSVANSASGSRSICDSVRSVRCSSCQPPAASRSCWARARTASTASVPHSATCNAGVVVGLHQPGQAAQPVRDHVEESAVQTVRHLLGEPGDPCTLLQRPLAVVWRGLPGDHPQQGRLALAVSAQHADPLAAVDREIDAVQQRRAVAQVDVAEGQQRHGSAMGWRRWDAAFWADRRPRASGQPLSMGPPAAWPILRDRLSSHRRPAKGAARAHRMQRRKRHAPAVTGRMPVNAGRARSPLR